MEWTTPQRHLQGPAESERLALGSLSDEELEAELTIAALAGGSFERGRYDRLLRERRRRAFLARTLPGLFRG
ncbi:MAG: hypothetical protein E6G08_02635 [Actinobacteria bacterium]|nr:MAG: hypothetical protein E6G08_02635 [Actinomycetota bacterium]